MIIRKLVDDVKHTESSHALRWKHVLKTVKYERQQPCVGPSGLVSAIFFVKIASPATTVQAGPTAA